jgi:hypothetical protein
MLDYKWNSAQANTNLEMLNESKVDEADHDNASTAYPSG